MTLRFPYTIKDGEDRLSGSHPSAETQSGVVRGEWTGGEGAFSAILNKLSPVKRVGKNKYRGACPTHDSRRDGLQVTLAPNGKILLYCFSGCSSDDIRRALGLDWAELFPDDGVRVRIQKKRRPLDALLVNRLLKIADPDKLRRLQKNLAIATMYRDLFALAMGGDEFALGEMSHLPELCREFDLDLVSVWDHLNRLVPFKEAA